MAYERGICPKSGKLCPTRRWAAQSIRICTETVEILEEARLYESPLKRKIGIILGKESTHKAAIEAIKRNNAELAGYLALNCVGDTCVVEEALERDSTYETHFFNPKIDRSLDELVER